MTQTVFITGADRGLGLALTHAFLHLNFLVFAGQYETDGELSDLLNQYPATLVPVPLDVTNELSVEKATATISRHSQSLDILINNAGVHLEHSRKPLEEVEFDQMSAMFNLNSLGPLRITRAFLPLLTQGEFKRIVNISSEAGSIGACWRDREFGYCMSKAALNMGSRILQNYLGPKGFKVLLVHPGWMRTDMGGPTADIDASEAAAGILTLALRSWSPGEGMYFDYTGRPYQW